MADESVNITWHEHLVSRQTREQTNGHRGCVVWFTGLSGSGKSTCLLYTSDAADDLPV